MSNSVKRYLEEIAGRMEYPEKTKKAILKELSLLIGEYCSERPDASIEDLYREFGNPSDYSEAFWDRKEYSDVLERVRKKTRLLTLLAAGLIILAVAAIITAVILIIKAHTPVIVSSVRIAAVLKDVL